ncbi:MULTISPECIES: hypothetical protein [Amycolatopsis]|uniref:Uncharacterized protein n=1 Tax=Amycolatopsis dendrobii TaxID=2760662 RepID=A0A7W3VXT2_9PSEU|nr:MULTISPECIES: hypothetical protein [Amycolatopsis]MBB1155041.1 hypothetical protein [Amycolatopsis dendrobii]UKD56151.1 hypothetical protein L3Q65_05385 [Amycolatopsis sp. FU40]
MSGSQLVVTIALGLLTVTGAFAGARMGARANDRATKQREDAARREEWWRRFTWAAELALDDSVRKRAAGLKLLAKLGRSGLATHDDNQLLDVFHHHALDRLIRDVEGGEEL